MLRRSVLTAFGALALPSAALAQAALPQPIQGGLGLTQITPENALERAFIAAFANEAERPAFRRQLLASQVALALDNSAEEAPVFIGPRAAAMIFTSAARLDYVLGPASPRRILRGRDALARLAANHIVLNYRLLPMLTLEPADIQALLELPEE